MDTCSGAGSDQASLGTRLILDHGLAQTPVGCELTAGSCGGGNLSLDLGANVERQTFSVRCASGCWSLEFVLDLQGD